MSLSTRITKHTLFSALSFSSNVFLLVLSIFAARHLGDHDFGIFSAALALVTLFEVLSDLGIRQLLTKEVARNKSNAELYFKNMAGLKLLLAGFTAIALVSTVFLLGYTQELRYVVYILAISMFLRSFKFTIRAFFRAFGKFEYEAALLLFERFLTLLLGTFVLFMGYGLIVFVSVFPIVRIFDLIVVLCVFHSQIARPKISLNILSCKKLLIGALPFALLLGLGAFYSRIDVVMLSVMRPAREVGWYSAAYNFIDVADMIPAVFSASVFPTLSVLYLSSKKDFSELCNRTIKYLFIAALPITMGGIILGNDLILLLFGDKYIHSTVVLHILLLSLSFSYLASIGAIALYSMDKQSKVIVALGTSVGLNVLLNFLLIPNYGYIGAACATALAQICNFSVVYLCLRREGYMIRLSLFWKPFFAASALALSAKSLLGYPLALPLLAGAATYIIFLFLLKTFDQSEVRIMRTLPALLWKR